MPGLLIIAVLPCIGLLPIFLNAPVSSTVLFVSIYVGLALLVLWVWRRVTRPMRYRIEGATLVVPGWLRHVRIPLTTAVVSTGSANGWKVTGTALPPYALGLFTDREGRYHAAATVEAGVWVRGARRVFVSPADVPGFVAALVAAGATADG
ncbi:MAG: hypothetical protein V4850_03395 [Myxococcota bacterium]